MKNDLVELVEIFSLRESSPASFTAPHLAAHFQSSLVEILATLDGITSKFVDIDTSFKEIDESQGEVFKSIVAKFHRPDLEEDLFELYRELNLYLIIRDRFGEAADWNLKEEFKGRLAPVVDQSMHKLCLLALI